MSVTSGERCRVCDSIDLLALTNLNGQVYLECTNCGLEEPVVRQPDPFPSAVTVSKYTDGRTRRRVSKRIGRKERAANRRERGGR